MLLAGKCHARAMYCTSANDIEDFGILLAGRPESSTAGRYIIEQVLDLGKNQYRLGTSHPTDIQ